MRQATTQQAPATPAAIPRTRDELNALIARRNELSTQLSSARDQRNELSSKVDSGTIGAKLGVPQARIAQLDQRITSIAADLADVDRALSAAPPSLVQTTSTRIPEPSGRLSADQVTGISIVFIITVMMPFAVGMVRLMLRRASRSPAPVPKEITEGLERMEQRIEAVALEVERIGEGQRFVTQLMNERAQRAAIPEAVPRAP